MDKYLKFADEAEMFEAMRSSGLLVMDKIPVYHDLLTIDIVGMIVDTKPMTDEEGNAISEATFVDGWHVNIRTDGQLPEELKPFEIEVPATPARVWA